MAKLSKPNKMDLSIIASVYNEQEVIEQFFSVLKIQVEKLGLRTEILFINDGSQDLTRVLLDKIAKQEENVKVIHFSKNFGHEAAMAAGIDLAQGKAVVCLDSDLQHPPQLLKTMYEKFEAGYAIVNMVRTKRSDISWTKKLASKYFYKVLNLLSKVKIEPNASDFFLISQRVATILREDFRERNRFLRGLIQTIGFPRTTIEFEAPNRVAGESKYSFFKLLLFSVSAIVATSQMPLKFSMIVGLIFGGSSLILGIFSIVMKFLENPVTGYTTIVVFVSLAFSIQFFILGILGEYIGNLFIETKHRPIYIIEQITMKIDDEL